MSGGTARRPVRRGLGQAGGALSGRRVLSEGVREANCLAGHIPWLAEVRAVDEGREGSEGLVRHFVAVDRCCKKLNLQAMLRDKPHALRDALDRFDSSGGGGGASCPHRGRI